MSTYWRPTRPKLEALVKPKPPRREVDRPPMVLRKATQKELRAFRFLAVNLDKTQVLAVTTDVEVVRPFRYWREYVRDRKTGTKEFEVVFGEKSVANALKVMDARRSVEARRA